MNSNQCFFANADLTQASAETILMVLLEKGSVKDISLMKHLIPLQKKLNLKLLRGKNTNQFIRAIANTLLIEGYVSITNTDKKANLTREDIKIVKKISV